MRESYRAALILAGLVLALSIASWRMVRLVGSVSASERPPRAAPQPQEIVVAPTPESQPARPPDTPRDSTAELIDAARHGDVAAVLALVRHGADINRRGAGGITPLLAAIKQGGASSDEIAKLIKAGADVTAEDSSGRDALSWAVEKDDVNTIAALLKNGRNPGFAAARALCDAAAQNHVEAMKALLDNGVDVNQPDRHGRTALLTALKQGGADTVRFLLDHDADLSHKNTDRMTPLMLAVARHDRDLMQVVLEKSSNLNERNFKGETALLQAARTDNTGMAKALVDAGADVNLPDVELTTPLMAAASAGSNDLVQILLDKGADVHAKDSQGETALSLARKNNHNDTADLLSKPGDSESGQP